MTYLNRFLAVACLLASGPLFAADTYQLDIGPQPLTTALQQFAKQSGLQVVYYGKIAQGHDAAGVSGNLTAAEALKRLLAGTELQFEALDRYTVAITSKDSSRTSANAFEGDATRLAQAVTDNSQGMQAAQPSPSEGEGQGEDKKQTTDTEKEYESARRAIPEILVKGSRGGGSLNADIERTPDDVQPYVVLDRQFIESSGASNLDDLLKAKLTMRYGAVSNNQQVAEGLGNQSSIALRGLSQSQTLILVDGRRVARQGVLGQTMQGDLNGIPLAAIERVEVLPATASGIYGGSATAGVVNVILRRNYSGFTPSFTYENSSRNDGRVRRANLIGGATFNGSKTNLMVTASYTDSEPIRIGDRAFVHEYADLIRSNTIAADPQSYYMSGIPPIGGTANITTVPQIVAGQRTAPVLTLRSGESLGSHITYVPTGYAGPQTDGGREFLQNAGEWNFAPPNSTQSLGNRQALLGGTKVGYGSVTARHAFTERVRAFLELATARNENTFDLGTPTGLFTVPAGVAGNPFQQSVRVHVPLVGFDLPNTTVSTQSSALAGIVIQLPREWSAELDYKFARSDLRQLRSPGTYDSTLQAAISSGTVNLFQDANLFSVPLEEFLVPPTRVVPTHSILNVATVRAAGPVGTLRGGPIVFSTLLEVSKDEFSPYTREIALAAGPPLTTTFTEQSSRAYSAYAEARLPFVSERNQRSWLNLLEAQISVRYDRYQMKGGRDASLVISPELASTGEFTAFSPTLGFRVRPIEDIMLRVSFATGFQPPALTQLQERTPTILRARTPPLRDPQRGNEPIGDILQDVGGSADLEPEDSESWSAGFVFTPRFVSGLRASVDWVRIKKTNNITRLFFAQETIDQEDVLPEVFQREPVAPGDPFGVGPIVRFDGSLLNGAGALSESFDLAVDWDLVENRSGRWAFSAAATRLLHSQEQTVLTIPLVENVGLISAPKWNANATMTWHWRSITGAWSTQYIDSVWVRSNHEFDLGQGSARIRSSLYHDAYASYRFDSSGQHLLSSLELNVGVKNVFDRRPELAANRLNAYDYRVSPALRAYYVTVKKDF